MTVKLLVICLLLVAANLLIAGFLAACNESTDSEDYDRHFRNEETTGHDGQSEG